MAGPQRLISRNLQVESRQKAGLVASLLAGLCIGALPTHAQGATWVGGGGGPEFGLWNAHQNWGEPGLAIPTGTAIFQTHEPTSVTISLTDQHPNPPTNIGSIQFDAGALAYSFTNNTTFDITSGGIVNNSASQQTFINNSLLNFLNSSTAGNTLPSTIVHTTSGGLTSFFDSSTGGLARFITDSGGKVDISTLTSAGMTSGSIEGAGTYNLGSKQLITGLNNLSTVVSGVIADGGAAGGTGGSLIKVGTGTLTVSGANTYTGNTAVNGGTLLVNGTLGSGAVNVSSGAMLGGTGTIGGPVTIQDGGILSPGVSPTPGTLTVGPLTLNSSSILNYKYGIPNVVDMGVNDLVVVNGNLTLAGKLNVIDVGGFSAGVYRLINYTGSLTGPGLGLGSLPSGFGFRVDIAHLGQVNLVVSGGLPTQFWDGSNMVPGNMAFGRGGNGTWNNTTTNTNWTTEDGTHNAAWGNGFAIFAGTAGTVTLGNNIRFTGMQFLTDGYLIQAPGSEKLLAAPNTIIRADVGITATISAPIVDDPSSGPARLTKSDAGTLILSGDNTYTGGTTISGGTLQLGDGGTTGSILGEVIDNGTLAFNHSGRITNFDDVISGGGQVLKLGGGALTLARTNSYSGGTFVDAGSLVAAANGALGSGLVTVNDLSLLRIDPGVTVTNFIELNNGGSLDNAGTAQVAAVIDGPAAAVTTAGGAAVTNEGGAKISDIGLIAIQSLNGPTTITNSGSIFGTQGILLRGGGTITNNLGGVISGLTGPAIATAAPASTAGPPLAPGPVTVVNSATITGATSGIILAGGGSVTNNASGQITGTSGTAISIGGSQARLSNAGQITGDVQLIASSNTAQLFTGAKISGNLTLNPGGINQVILDGSGTQLLSQSVTGAISNAGTLTKQGTGEWILDKNLSPPVSTLISSGILQVNSGQVLTSPTVTIGAGGELSGLGTIAGSVVNNGLVSPGDAPGTLTVTGNYTQGSSGALNIQLASGSHGLLAVGGSAFLGGTLRLSLVGGFVPPGGQRFTILTAGTGVSGTFGLVQQPAMATALTVIYDPKDVTVVAEQIPFQNFACNPNSRSVLTALQSVRNTATGDLGVVIGVLNGLPTNELCAAGSEISPLPVPSLPTQVINSLDNANTWLDQRLWFLEQPFDPNDQWNIYVDGGGTFGRIKNIFDLPALDFDTGWTTPGADYRLNPSLAFGVYAGYAHSESRFADGTHVSTDTPSAGTYGLWNPPFMGPFGLDAGFGGGYNDYSMKRPIGFGDPIDRHASSDPRSHYYKYRLGTSYHKKFDKLNLEFLGSYEYANINSDQFFEHGAGSLDTRVGSYSVPSLRQYFGIHLVYDIPVANKVTITPDLRFTWIHEYLYGSRGIPVSLDSGAGPNFVLTTPQGPRDEYISVIGFYAVFGELKGYLYWTSDFGSGVVTSNSIMGGITLNF